jgi:nucleotide-binding universal stress UspA family protein
MTTAFHALTVPIDASATAPHGIDQAMAIAGRLTKLHFCSVVEFGAVSAAGITGAMIDPEPMIRALEADAVRMCDAAVNEAREHGIAADGSVRVGAAASTITAFVHETNSDGILICTHARTGLRRVLSGSVTESVLCSSDVPVIVTHADDDLTADGPITVAVDGSSASDAALATAISLATAGLQALSILHVVESDAAWPEASGILSAAAERARDANLEFELVTLRGAAAKTIVDSARRRGSPMIVLGTHGRTAVARAVLGSVAAAVIETATLPVTVVRRP